jgi:hypothetical protein
MYRNGGEYNNNKKQKRNWSMHIAKQRNQE